MAKKKSGKKLSSAKPVRDNEALPAEAVEGLNLETNGHKTTEETLVNTDTIAPEKPESKNIGAEDDESASGKDQDEVAKLQTYIEQLESERDDIQEEYENLLEKVGTIKQRLGERFKELEAETAAATNEKESAEKRAGEAERRAKEAEKRAESVEERVKDAEARASTAENRASTAENRATSSENRVTSMQNELKSLRDQQVAQKIMFDQELVSEREAKQTLELEIEKLRAKNQVQNTNSEQIQKTCDRQESEIARLKKELASARKLHEETDTQQTAMISKLESEREALKTEVSRLLAQLSAQTESSLSSNERLVTLETESRQSQLLIGKLRHEAVILNDHLTNALRLVRKDAEGSTVDKELVSNLFVQFATCPRQDTKKFEILQLIANFLGWDENRKQLVGLTKGSTDLDWTQPQAPQQQHQQMVGVVGKLAEFIESKRSSK